MALALYDTFDGVLDTNLLDRPGTLGTAWTRHPVAPATGAQNDWKLSGNGRAYTPNFGYAPAHHLASGTPAASEYDLRVPFRLLTVGGDAQVGVTFRGHATAESYWRLIFLTDVTYRGWYLLLRVAGSQSTLGSYLEDPAADSARDVLIEVRDAGVTVRIDGTIRITSAETAAAGARVGIYGSNTGASATTGIHLDALMVGPPGFIPPIYSVTGPTGSPPGFESDPFTVALNPGENPGSLTVTPSVSGITGTFSPTSVTLLDADRTDTFTFTPTSTGTGSITFSDGTAAEDAPAHTYAAVAAGPVREAYWASRLYDRSSAGAHPYDPIPLNPDGSGGYYLDGPDHYDCPNAYRQVQEYSIRKGLAVTDYSDMMALAMVALRDRAILSDIGPDEPGVAGRHRFLTGIAWHYFANPDLADAQIDIAAADILGITPASTAERLEESFIMTGTSREAALFALMTLDHAWMGRGEHPMTDTAAGILLDHVEQWTEPEETKHYGVFLKPWMGGLTMRSLIRYWERYREHAAAEKVALCAAIPPAIEALLGYTWDECWFPVGTTVTISGGLPWDKGALTYRDVPNGHPRWEPIEDVPVTYVEAGNPNRVFRCASLTSTIDDYFVGAAFIVEGIADSFICVGYTGATRQVTLSNYYYPGRALTTSDVISIFTVGYDPDEGPGPVPDLNMMAAPAFAWMYWYKRRFLDDFEASKPYRSRFHAMFNGAIQAWGDTATQKQYNEAALWIVDGIAWAERGDAEWPAATTYTLEAPAAGAGGAAGAESGAFRISVPYGQRLDEPVEIVPSSSTGLGTFSGPNPILSSDIRSAMFTFTPDAADDGTAVNISVSSALADPSPVAYAVGEVEGGALVAGSISITTAATATTVGLTVTEATGGTGPYTRQWHRSTTSGFTPDASNDLPGATALTLDDTGLTAGVTYYYKVVHADAAAASVATSQRAVATAAASGTVLYPIRVLASGGLALKYKS